MKDRPAESGQGVFLFLNYIFFFYTLFHVWHFFIFMVYFNYWFIFFLKRRLFFIFWGFNDSLFIWMAVDVFFLFPLQIQLHLHLQVLLTTPHHAAARDHRQTEPALESTFAAWLACCPFQKCLSEWVMCFSSLSFPLCPVRLLLCSRHCIYTSTLVLWWPYLYALSLSRPLDRFLTCVVLPVHSILSFSMPRARL